MSWYQQMRAHAADITPSPFPAAGTPHLLEVVIGLGATLAGAGPLPFAVPSLLSSAGLHVELSAVLQDEDGAGNTAVVPSIPFSAQMPLAQLSQVGAPGAPTLLYGVIDFGAYITGLDAPVPARPGYTRRLVAKVLRGAGLTAVPPGSPPALTFTVDGVPFSAAAAIMGTMDPASNCFPGAGGALPAGCALGSGVATATSVYAAEGSTAASVPCVGAPGATSTPCVRSFAEPAPARLLLFLQVARDSRYTPGVGWVPTSPAAQVAYFTHGHAGGVRIPLSAPCFPAPECASASSSATTITSGTLIIILLVAVTALVTGVAMWVLRPPAATPRALPRVALGSSPKT